MVTRAFKRAMQYYETHPLNPEDCRNYLHNRFCIIYETYLVYYLRYLNHFVLNVVQLNNDTTKVDDLIRVVCLYTYHLSLFRAERRGTSDLLCKKYNHILSKYKNRYL